MSKRILQHPEIPAEETTQSWRSIGQLEDTPAFREWLEREFPRGAAEMASSDEMETSRRSFLKLMGASTALAGLGTAACRRPEKYTVPYTQAPEWVIPGKALYYATAMPRAAGATPLVVTTFEGRPTKLAPNPLHPDADGTDAFAQASILDLYSPSRSKTVMVKGQAAQLADVSAAIKSMAASGKMGFVFGADESPTRSRLIQLLAKKYPQASFYGYEALSPAVGAEVRTVANYQGADRILSLDCDFAALDPQGPVTPFFDRRKPEGKDYKKEAASESMNRLYVVESQFSLTGGMADHRLRLAPSQILPVAAEIAKRILAATGKGSLGVVVKGSVSEKRILEWIEGVCEDLMAARGRSMVLAGSRCDARLRNIAMEINAALGNVGEGRPIQVRAVDHAGLGDLHALQSAIEAKKVEHLVLLTPANPVFDAPADMDVASWFGKLKSVMHWGMRLDATAHAASVHVPAAHYLESWSDTRTSTGLHTLIQPMILPLYPACVSELELLSAFLHDEFKLVTGEESAGLAAVRATVAGRDEDWRKALREGFVDKAYAAAGSWKPLQANGQVLEEQLPSETSLDVIFATDASIYDGRWIDNAWLQESPDPVSKLTWDNAALISPKTAKALGIYDQIIELESARASVSPDGEGQARKSPVVAVELNGKRVEIAILVAFGLAENTIVLPVGYGQGYDQEHVLKLGPDRESHVSLVGVNRGFNVFPLRTSQSTYVAQGAKVTTTTKRYPVALTQEHNAMYGRALAREISTLKSDKGDFAAQYAGVTKQGNDSHAPENISLYKQQGSATWNPGADGKAKPLLSDELHQWAMNIDLSSCMGCNACLVACQAENNIPVVGKDQLAMGREMHWIRMDRYYAAQEGNTFDADNPAMVPQPVACVQCESAPCETVCPVNATVHTEDGLNSMAYNRCIGTRYCANNCPYKARRFNFFDYNKRNPLIAHNLYKGPFGEKQVGQAPHLQRNPNVTVRMRGVMEKCTYCVQRLKDAKIRQKRGQKQEVLASGRLSTEHQVNAKTLRIPVGGVKVACQEACPAQAISFGNILDGDQSQVVRARSLARSYELLHYIGTVPRTLYMARVKNPNARMPDAQFIGKATIHMA